MLEKPLGYNLLIGMYRQFVDLNKIKHALYKAFETDTFVASQQYVGWWLCSGEPVNVYLADLCKISVFGSMNDQIMGYAFSAGLPEDVSRLLWLFSRLDELPTD